MKPDPNERIGEFRCDDCGRHLANFLIMFKPGQAEAIESIKIRCANCGAEPWPEGHAEATS